MNRCLVHGLVVLCAVCHPVLAAGPDPYVPMLDYLTSSRIDGQALRAASGSIKLNQASGDLNNQLNAHLMASGRQAQLQLPAAGQVHGNAAHAADTATAVIAGNVLAGGIGAASINQVSGTANSQLNALGVVQGQQVRLQDQAVLNASRPALPLPLLPTRLRRVEIAASALQGFQGVLQINQIAGSANVAENRLGLLVQTGP